MAKEIQAAYSNIYMHPRNRHQDRYQLKELSQETPELKSFILINKYGDESIDFSNAEAVKTLNKAILKASYGIQNWDIPDAFLCPPIPGRADYIHSGADLFSPRENLRVLDIGTGANCIYPILGVKEYNWNFVGSDINPLAIKNSEMIITKNGLGDHIKLIQQKDPTKIFENIIQENDFFHLTICNPPFHESLEDANAGTNRKWKNLGKKPGNKLNFGGQGAELWCPGGEKTFIQQMMAEAPKYKNQVKWFTTLVSKEAHLPALTKTLQKQGARIKIIEMTQGQKKSRVLCWTYIPE